MSNAEKLKALKLTIDKIDKDYGKGKNTDLFFD